MISLFKGILKSWYLKESYSVRYWVACCSFHNLFEFCKLYNYIEWITWNEIEFQIEVSGLICFKPIAVILKIVKIPKYFQSKVKAICLRPLSSNLM